MLRLLAWIEGRDRPVVAHYTRPDFAALTLCFRQLMRLDHGVAPYRVVNKGGCVWRVVIASRPGVGSRRLPAAGRAIPRRISGRTDVRPRDSRARGRWRRSA